MDLPTEKMNIDNPLYMEDILSVLVQEKFSQVFWIMETQVISKRPFLELASKSLPEILKRGSVSIPAGCPLDFMLMLKALEFLRNPWLEQK